MALIFDIETISSDFESLDSVTQKMLTYWIRQEAGSNENLFQEKLTELKENLNFSPLTGSIAVIGVYDTEKNKGVVYFQAPDVEMAEYVDGNFTFKPATEAEMIEKFWRGAAQYREFISFNGRSFDVPFLLIRSAVHKIKPTKDLMFNRYLNSQPSNVRHIDLLDQLSFYGAVKRKSNLHLYCKIFGIKSPKGEGITGEDIDRLFKEKKYKEIAEYNSWDLIATWELYERWREYIYFK